MAEERAADLLAPHPVVAAVAGGGTGARRFTGYVGESGDDGTVRLFCNLTLDEYWDIGRGDILGVNEVPASDGKVTLLVRSSARLPHTRVRAVGEATTGLTGDVMQRALARSSRLSSRGFGRLGIGWTITVTIVTILSDDQGGDGDGGS